MSVDTARQTVMIVEDDQGVVELLKDVLESEGYVCIWESHGELVLQRALLEQPSLILLDIKLGGIDGYTICRRLRRHPTTKSIPIIFISALKTDKDVMEAKDAGGDYFVAKPFNINFVLQKMRELILHSALEGEPQTVPRRILFVQSGFLSSTLSDEQALSSLFSENDFDIFLVRDPGETIRRTREIKPDLIVLDLDSSLLSFSTVISALRRFRQTQAVPILILTSVIGGKIPVSDKESILTDVLSKPFSETQLLTSIHTMLDCDKMKIAGKAIPVYN